MVVVIFNSKSTGSMKNYAVGVDSFWKKGLDEVRLVVWWTTNQ